MGEFAETGRIFTEGVGQGDADHELSHIDATVGADGSARIVLHTTEGMIDLSVPADIMATASAEIDRARVQIFRHNLQNQDRGKSAFEDLVHAAPMPAKIIATIDGKTGDRIVVYRFRDRMPIVVRLTADQLAEARADLDYEAKRLSN